MESIKLREYQIEPSKFALKEDLAVLAMAPNGGKTEIAIYVIQQYLKENPNNKVLILPHSTNVLLDNFVQRLEKYKNILDFNFSTEFEKNAQVHISLPQSKKRIMGKYDFVVVDEAHENYLANRVQGIIKRTKPKKQLLLTGTPSRFIYQNMLSKQKGEEEKYKIHILALMDIPEKFYARLAVELVSSNYDWKEKDYTKNLSIKDTLKYNIEDTEKSLEIVLAQLIKRLQCKVDAESFNKSNFIPNIRKYFLAVLNSLGKTIIYASNVQHANQIYEVLKNNKLNVTVSHSKEVNGLETDTDSIRIQEFQEGKYDILIVVDRAKLGYSDSDVRNIIDMSGTMNPDLIYQMLCRAVRGTQENKNYYLKVTPINKARKDLTACYTNMALQLMDKETISKYNGKNMNEQLIVVEHRPVEKVKEKGSKKRKSKKTNETKIHLPQFINDVHNFFKDVTTNESNPASIYKKTSLGEVRHRLDDLKTLPNNYWTLERCKEEALKYNTRNEWGLNNQSSYNKARKNDWLELCCRHMVDMSNKSNLKQLLQKLKDRNIDVSHIDFSKSIYRNSNTKMKVVDRDGFVHEKIPSSLLLGKTSLSIISAKDKTEYFKFMAEKVNENRYDLSKVKYKNSKEKVEIICKKHGSFFIEAGNFLQGCGCKKCAILTKINLMKKISSKPIKNKQNNKPYQSLKEACNKEKMNYRKEQRNLKNNPHLSKFEYITEEEYNKLKENGNYRDDK